MRRHELQGKFPSIERRRIRGLVRALGIESTSPKPNASKRRPGQTVYPYLLRDVTIGHANQVWAMDITFIPMSVGVSASHRKRARGIVTGR